MLLWFSSWTPNRYVTNMRIYLTCVPKYTSSWPVAMVHAASRLFESVIYHQIICQLLWRVPEAHIVTSSKHNPSAHIQFYWCRACAVGRMSSWANLPPTSPHPSFENLPGVLQLVHLSPLAPECQKQIRRLENRCLLSSPIRPSNSPSGNRKNYWCGPV